MKKIWNKIIVWGFKHGLWRGKHFIGTREEAFQAAKKMLGIKD